MFATNEEAAELAYERAKLTQLDSDGTESYSGSDYNIANTALAKHPALAKLRSLAVILRDDKFNQAFKQLSRSFLECPATIPKIPGETRWNGWLLMIEEAFRTRPVLDALYAQYADALELVLLTNNDWALLEHVTTSLCLLRRSLSRLRAIRLLLTASNHLWSSLLLTLRNNRRNILSTRHCSLH
jgi:hypothetical protein